MITKCSCRISCGRSILFGGLHALSSFSQICYSSQLLSFFRLHSVTFISLFSNCRQSLCPLKEKMFFKAALKIFLIFFKKIFRSFTLNIFPLNASGFNSIFVPMYALRQSIIFRLLIPKHTFLSSYFIYTFSS